MVSQNETSMGPSDGVDALLERGLAFFGGNKLEQAIACWHAVLRIEPSNPQALDYLRAAGVSSTSTPTATSSAGPPLQGPPIGSGSVEGLQQHVVQLMRER